MIGFSSIKKILVPLSCLQEVYDIFRTAGASGLEAVALFAGTEKNSKFEVKEAIIPKQTSVRLEQGLMYSVNGDELYRISKYLYENNFSIMAQIHSHPQEAYHSEADDRYPIVTTIGGLSIVVPDFGFGAIDIENWAVYRLSEKAEWLDLDLEDVIKLIKIV